MNLNPRKQREGEANDDGLFALQLRVAKKADELARQRAVEPGLNLHCWLLAEAEILLVDEMPPSRGERDSTPPRRV